MIQVKVKVKRMGITIRFRREKHSARIRSAIKFRRAESKKSFGNVESAGREYRIQRIEEENQVIGAEPRVLQIIQSIMQFPSMLKIDS